MCRRHLSMSTRHCTQVIRQWSFPTQISLITAVIKREQFSKKLNHHKINPSSNWQIGLWDKIYPPNNWRLGWILQPTFFLSEETIWINDNFYLSSIRSFHYDNCFCQMRISWDVYSPSYSPIHLFWKLVGRGILISVLWVVWFRRNMTVIFIVQKEIAWGV